MWQLYFILASVQGVGTKIDPTLCRADRLVGQVLGTVGALPDIFTELEISYFLLRRLLGVRTEGDKRGAKVSYNGHTCFKLTIDKLPNHYLFIAVRYKWMCLLQIQCCIAPYDQKLEDVEGYRPVKTTNEIFDGISSNVLFRWCI